MKYLPKLIEGDCLLYRPADFVGWCIAVKTWTRVSHVEVYVGGGDSVASRNGIGVNRYGVRLSNVAAVLRPKSSWSLPLALDYFERVRGEAYDWKDLLIFGLLVKRGDRRRQICSEFAANFYAHGRLDVRASHWPAERVSPSLFLFSPAFHLVWHQGELF